jgi:hypothetical protein
MRFLSLLLALLLRVSAEVVPVDVLITFESGNNGDALSTSYLDSVTRGTGVNAWTTAVATPVDSTVSTTGSATINSPFWIRSTAYEDGSGDTRGAAILLASNDENYWSLPFTATHDNVTVSFDFKFTGTTGDGDLDLFSITCSGGQALVMHLDTNGTDDFTIHTGSPSDEIAMSPAVINNPSKTYRCTLRWRRNNDCHMAIYDRADGSLLGSNTLSANNVAATGIRLGVDMHGVSSNGSLYIDNIAIDWTAVKYPLGPGGGDPLDAPYYVRTDGNDSNTGLSNNAGGAFLTIAAAEAIVSPGDIVRIQAGSYDAGTTMDVDGASGALITFVGDGAAITRNLIITGDYIRIVNFDFTHFASDSDVTPIVVNDCIGSQIIDCYFYETGHGLTNGQGGGIRIGNVTSGIFRGNVITLSGTNGETGTPTEAKDFADYFGKTSSDNVLIEYNSMSHSAEYMNLSGTDYIIRNNVYGPTTTSDWGGAPHIDALQLNATFSQGYLGENWHVENATDDAHLYLDQGTPSRTTSLRIHRAARHAR